VANPAINVAASSITIAHLLPALDTAPTPRVRVSQSSGYGGIV